MSLFYSNPLGGRAGIFTISYESNDAAVTWLNCFDFYGFCRWHFPRQYLAGFLNVVFSLE